MGFFLKKPKPPTGVIAGARDGLSSESISRFLLPASECEFTLNSVLEELQKDPWTVPSDQRATRCTSTALCVAASLLGACVPGSGARIMAFIGGPSTEGLGAIVSKNLSEPIRSHKDLDKDSAPHYHKAVKFYEGLAKQLVHQGHVLDLFACALDQVGIAELKVAVEKTGGLVVLAESFGHSVFKDSLRRVFQLGDYDLGLSSNGIFEINCSKDTKVQGIIGPCASLEKKGPLCSDTVIGQGNTSAWKMCGLDKATTLCIIFEIVKKDSPDASVQPSSNQFYFQFLTYYQHSSGQMRLRVTTLSRRWVAGPGSIQDLIAGFDQEAAAVAMARLVSFKMEIEAEFDPIRWLDKALIHMCSRFGDYQKDSPSSFSLSPRFSIFPQFMFHLRRSQFVQVFNNSPDETAYFRIILNRENVANSVAFAQLLQAPRDDADVIIRERFPVPRLVICDQHGSQARFLLAKLNPSATYNTDAPLPGGDILFTDDGTLVELHCHINFVKDQEYEHLEISLKAESITLLSFDALGKCIPIIRGAGIYQEHMNEALEHLSNGAWLHAFPQGKVLQEDAPIRRLKWGTVSLIVRSPITPIVLPIVLQGFEVVMPENYWFGRRPPFPLCNKIINIVVGEPMEFDLPKMRQMAISMSRNLHFRTRGWPSISHYGLDEAAQRYLYMAISEQIQTVMENLRCLGKSSVK
ncbi:hypothetical protein GH714_035010 [Hevea brasiliensis]|uniref:Protein transport protein SEC23 n=1 Tax=Hevea brasiliensis TaxID=3981 RepID=A0A6A6MFJ7_HEVBR|nr:hypothetical protein GH714_035010 [Hevea brasiliensis]